MNTLKSGSRSLPCRTNACQYPTGNNQTCGETETLGIIKEFQQLYENKMKQIDSEGCGDCLSSLQAKINLQHKWIKDLTEQNEMLVKAVEELEVEATERVLLLEERLRCSAKQGSEVMQKYRDFSLSINLDGTFQKLVQSLRSDLHNVLEFIRRVRDEDNWNLDGLKFHNIQYEDLLGGLGGDVRKPQPNKCKVIFQINENIPENTSYRPTYDKFSIKYPVTQDENALHIHYKNQKF